MKFDVTVVGAGIAGCVAAKFAARKGLRVCILELKERSLIGEKVCGDGVGKHEFGPTGVALPRGEEIDRIVKGVKICGKNDELLFTIKGEGYTLNRRAFGQRLLKEALDAGSNLIDCCVAINPILKDGKVKGVLAKDIKSGKKIELESSVTIDASGLVGIIKNKLPSTWEVSEKISKKDIGVGYREIRRTNEELDDYCRMYYNWQTAPGGYCWIIPKRGPEVNTGFIVLLRKQISTQNLKKQFGRFIASTFLLKKSSCIKADSGLVPMRRPLSCAVANGFMVVGDAAYQANPYDGGGIGSAMYAGRIAAETVSKVLGEGQARMEKLWRYNVMFMINQGSKHAANDILKEYLQSLSESGINMLLKILSVKQTYSSGDLFKELSESKELKSSIGSFGDRRFLIGLMKMIKTMKRARQLYLRYPEMPSKYSLWRKKTSILFE